MHLCPAFDGAAAHGGGPVIMGCLEVLIGGQPAARIGDLAACGGAARRRGDGIVDGFY